MEDPFKELDYLLGTPEYKMLLELHLIDEIRLRNILIKREYRELRKIHSAIFSMEKLINKYHLSDSALNSILFRTIGYKRKSLSLYC